MKTAKFALPILILLSLTAGIFAQTTEKPDALLLYRRGRDLEAVGRTQEADQLYNQSIEICKQELVANPRNLDSYTVMVWSLLRIDEYAQVVSYGQEALKINANDYRIIEALGEAYFYLNNFSESLRMMEKYIDSMPTGERISIAYFFVGEIYRNQKKYNKADIAYTAETYKEKTLPLWWFRMGQVREQAGDKAGANAAYQQALKLNPSYREAQQGVSRTS